MCAFNMNDQTERKSLDTFISRGEMGHATAAYIINVPYHFFHLFDGGIFFFVEWCL